MPMNRETGKDRWRRVPKDYFKSRDKLQSVKFWFSVLAAVLAVAWFVSGVDRTRPTSWSATDLNSIRANHGTLARVHAAWDQKCDACHVPFESIHGRPLFTSSSSAPDRAGEKRCTDCHAGPIHHELVKNSEVKGCAECHRDHQGRDFSLVRLPDNECTRCHSALKDHVKEVDPNRTFLNVNRFDIDHPTFTPEAADKVGNTLQDRGKLKFNHARHMTPGIVKKLGDTPYTVEHIPLVEAWERYKGDGKLTDPVQLDCSSCHQLDSTEIQSKVNPAIASTKPTGRSLGEYYLPVTFENQCRACHILTFDPRRKDLEVPHGVQPDQVVEFVNQAYAVQALSDDPKLLDVFATPVRVPGKNPVPATARKRFDDSVANALTSLFPRDIPGQGGSSNNCLECHHYDQIRLDGVPKRVVPTEVPEIWFTRASFDHTAHRGVSCRDCHPRSYAMDKDGLNPIPDASSVATDVLIPSLENCQKCHAPAKGMGWFASTPKTSTGGASFDCTECHRYHNGDWNRQGPGASARDADSERSFVEFLQGSGGWDRPMSKAKSPVR